MNGWEPGYYDMDGKKISLMEWASNMESPNARRVAMTKLPNGIKVSTVLLGISHGEDEDGRPIIFESMAFGSDDSGEIDCVRYCTKEDALKGHEEMVATYRGSKTVGALGRVPRPSPRLYRG